MSKSFGYFKKGNGQNFLLPFEPNDFFQPFSFGQTASEDLRWWRCGAHLQSRRQAASHCSKGSRRFLLRTVCVDLPTHILLSPVTPGQSHRGGALRRSSTSGWFALSTASTRKSEHSFTADGHERISLHVVHKTRCLVSLTTCQHCKVNYLEAPWNDRLVVHNPLKPSFFNARVSHRSAVWQDEK